MVSTTCERNCLIYGRPILHAKDTADNTEITMIRRIYWFTLKERNKHVELREMLTMKPARLVIKKVD